MAEWFSLAIDVCPGLGISPLRQNIWLRFCQADFGPRSGQELFFVGVFEKFEILFSKICCAHSEQYKSLFVGIFEILTFRETSRFHCHRS